VQIEIELTLCDERFLVLAHQPQTTLSGDVVGPIEETVTTEDSNSLSAAVAATIPIPGLEAAQIGPSVNVSDTGRTVRTQKLRRQPHLAAVVVAGSTARGRGVFFHLRPAPEVSLEGAHLLTLQIAAPRGERTATLGVECRAVAQEDWLLFDREAKVASAKGKVTIRLLDDPAASEAAAVHGARGCPVCDIAR
jgi:hypothetical protein